MGARSATGAITREEGFTPVEETLQHGINEVFRGGDTSGQKIKNAFGDTWLRHPFRAALTDIPIRAWMAAVVVDAIDNTRIDICSSFSSSARRGDGTMRRVEYKGTPILLARSGNRLVVLAENCPYWGGQLSQGKITDHSVKCPWHGSGFALEDGHVQDRPAVHLQPCLRARVRNGQIEIGKVVATSEISLAQEQQWKRLLT